MDLLKKVVALEIEAEAFGFSWETPEQIIKQIHSEIEEIEEQLSNKEINIEDLEEETGDLMHAVYSLAVFLKLNPEVTLKKSVDKFEKRLKAVKKLTDEQGLKNLKGQDFETLMNFWKKAKREVG